MSHPPGTENDILEILDTIDTANQRLIEAAWLMQSIPVDALSPAQLTRVKAFCGQLGRHREMIAEWIGLEPGYGTPMSQAQKDAVLQMIEQGASRDEIASKIPGTCNPDDLQKFTKENGA